LYNRKCSKYPLTELVGDPDLPGAAADFYIDDENAEEVVDVLTEFSKKTRRIIYEIENHRYNPEQYEKLKGYNDVTVFVYRGKTNYRIFCREFKNGKKKIVLIKAHHKKSKEYTHKELNIVNSIIKYVYEFNK
jgi:hypothetical protein